jgi:hypothetical protein
MKYTLRLTLILISLALVSSTLFAQSKSSAAVNTTKPSVATDREFVIQFAHPMRPTEVATLVRRMKIKPKELLYEFPGEQDDVIAGGYVLDAGQEIDSAITDMTKKHAAFLEEALKSVDEQVGASSDASTVENLKKLGRSFSKLLEEVQESRFTLRGLKVADVSDVAMLHRIPQIRSVIEVGKRNTAEPLSAPSGNHVFRPVSYWHESWAPYYGTAKVNQGSSFQTFYFNNVTAFGSTSTYEHETQIYNKSFANFANYWSSNLPYSYFDTPFLDSIDNFTVGSARAVYLRTYVQYYTYVALRAGSAYTATVRIKGQKGYRSPSFCTSPWCIWPQATTSSLTTFTAPIYYTRTYQY